MIYGIIVLVRRGSTNKVLPIIGVFLGAIVGTIPWVLVYIFGNMMFSMLAVIIAFCSLKGYTICKGQITKRTPILIIVSSIVAVVLATLVIIPLCLLSKEGFEVSLSNLMIIYRTEELMTGFLSDAAIGVLFTALGIGGVIKSTK